VKIKSYEFGRIEIDGKAYTSVGGFEFEFPISLHFPSTNFSY